MNDLTPKIVDKLLEQFDKYPDPMEVEHMADLLGCKTSSVYYSVRTHPKDIPHVRIGNLIKFPKVQVIPWWVGTRNKYDKENGWGKREFSKG
jgi:hypothetical protein